VRRLETSILKDELSLEGLNEPQKEAVQHVGGPLLIIAGAGSGKTRVLTHRIAYLVKAGQAKPFEILAITFTNKAANEMRERVERLLGISSREMMIGTFHSCCARILRREITRLGFTPNFTIYDEADSLRLIGACIDEAGLSRKQFPPGAIKAVVTRAKNEMIDEEQYSSIVEDFFHEVVSTVYKRYQERLRENNALDFDDLLLVTVNLFELYPRVLEKYRRRFKHVLVDEYQDTNMVQYRLVRLLVEEHKNLCVVGDDDQGIYSWRGADIRNILEFENDYPDAKVVRLEQNYRSTPDILNAASSVVINNSSRKAKNLWTARPKGEKPKFYLAEDEHAEANFVVTKVKELVRNESMNYSDIAIFYRVHAQSRLIEEALLREGIPYRIFGGVRFYDRQEIRDTIAYLRVIVNASDELSLRRIINVPPRGIGKTTLKRLEEYSRVDGLPLFDVCKEASDIHGLSNSAAKKLSEFHALIEGLRNFSSNHETTDVIKEVWKRTGYMEALQNEGTLEAQSRIENLEELLNVVSEFQANFGAVTLLDFLERVSLVDDTEDLDESRGYVSLMTLHNAKGLEFPCVFIVGMEEGLFPHVRSMDSQEEIEEERRLCYVGMTRSQDLLYLSACACRSLRGRLDSNPISRFVEEIPDELIERSEYEDVYSEKESISVEEGERIIHAKWGEGLVVSVENLSDDTEITVDFESVGRKRLLLRYAPIEKVSDS